MPWYLPTLGTTLLAIQGVSIWRTPSEELPPPVMEDVVFAAPPKPETQRDTDADGSVESYTWERCRAIPASYQDECFGALARQLAPTDPEGGLLACEEIAKRPRRLECMADVAEGYAPSDRDFSLSMCTTIPARKWRDQCVFGIAMAYVDINPVTALDTCELSGMWKKFCRHDVNGERSVRDSSASVAYCNTLPDNQQLTCWHGIGKYIGRVDLFRAFEVCQQADSTLDIAGQCMHGVGWAAGEQQGADAANLCDRAGSYSDSCILGVAYQSKRYEPAIAQSLCETARDPKERKRCLDFVTRKTTPGPQVGVP